MSSAVEEGQTHDKQEFEMRVKRYLQAGLLASTMSMTHAVLAHVTLETTQAAAGSYYKTVLRVPHGCSGSATIKLRVQIPEGLVAIKPQPKPGWELSMTRGDYARSYHLHGASITSGVREVAWTGGPLPDDQFDEFAFMTYLAEDLADQGRVYLPVVQECEQGVERWIDKEESSEFPAPVLHILESGS